MADANNKRRRDPQFTTPIGTFQYPSLDAPSYGTDKFPKPEGVYRANLILPANDAAVKKFIADLKPHHDEAMAAAQDAFAQLPVASRRKLGSVSTHPLYEVEYDKETEQPTGNIVFRFKLTASGVYKKGPKAGEKWSARPALFDARGNKMNNPPAIWGGTKGRVSFSAGPMFVSATGLGGLSYRLIGAQIIDLVTKGDRSAESLGFGAVDGGYEVDPDDMGSASTGTTRSLEDDLGDEVPAF